MSSARALLRDIREESCRPEGMPNLSAPAGSPYRRSAPRSTDVDVTDRAEPG
jgi:hypothetical protein